MLKATVDGLKNLRRPEEVAKTRGVRIVDVLPPARVTAEEEAEPVVVAVAEEPAAEEPAAEEPAAEEPPAEEEA
jgi:hypothetical protein